LIWVTQFTPEYLPICPGFKHDLCLTGGIGQRQKPAADPLCRPRIHVRCTSVSGVVDRGHALHNIHRWIRLRAPFCWRCNLNRCSTARTVFCRTEQVYGGGVRPLIGQGNSAGPGFQPPPTRLCLAIMVGIEPAYNGPHASRGRVPRSNSEYCDCTARSCAEARIRAYHCRPGEVAKTL